MGKSYEEQIKELQNKISTLKKQQKEQKKKRALELGEAFFRLLPDAEAQFDKEGFNLEEYLKDVLGMKEDIPQENISDEDEIPYEEELPAQQTEVRNSYGTYNQNNF